MKRSNWIFEALIMFPLIMSAIVRLPFLKKSSQSTITISGLTIASLWKFLFLEGTRISSIFLLSAEALILAKWQLHNKSPILKGSIMICSLCYFVLTYYLPTCKLPKPTGHYLVGYKIAPLGNEKCAAVFYPTQEKTNDIRWCYPGYRKRMYEMSKLISVPLPKLFYDFLTNFLTKPTLGVNIDAPICRLRREDREMFYGKYPIIIMSHGLSATPHFYSMIVKELASKGFIIFCPDHDEKIFLGKKTHDEISKMRIEQLKERSSTVGLVIDRILDHKFMDEFFDRMMEVEIDFITIMGHSFGGATGLYSSCFDPRIRGPCIVLDPAVSFIDEDTMKQDISRPLLVIHSETFQAIWVPKNNEKDTLKTFFQNNSYRKASIFKTIAKMDHSHYSDAVYLMRGELELFKNIRGHDKMDDFVTIINYMLYEFWMACHRAKIPKRAFGANVSRQLDLSKLNQQFNGVLASKRLVPDSYVNEKKLPVH